MVVIAKMIVIVFVFSILIHNSDNILRLIAQLQPPNFLYQKLNLTNFGRGGMLVKKSCFIQVILPPFFPVLFKYMDIMQTTCPAYKIIPH
jgi:hypothetical protein